MFYFVVSKLLINLTVFFVLFSLNQYLELRFNKVVRICGTLTFICQMVSATPFNLHLLFLL